ncbi:carboxypeptidase-like regulatory domain-containing protein [Aequorivita echinoideorum]|uniref:Carboxypeptidase-like regulatory domain-containing protein n=1 Tax=Aequorivita echinoideorum TaxID=1549647 RepID=A0ABS5S228_9FLAO|nr:carboxypeptidase-like regulatory domain-containing protein [Aequorivita echinoideorum]MBT0607251.1 carboxypeptidase-like regulatory domain-containing protein [Aequorivita echinoideorum]
MGKRIKRYFILLSNCLILSLSGNFAYSQSVISGTVKDTLQNPIPYVNVLLKAENQDGIIAFSTTTENGTYKILTDKEGNFELTFSSISFKKNIQSIFLEKDKEYKIDANLKEETFALDEVIVNTDKAITVKKDSIIFKADAFKSGNEETVEDLLKNIPGINVESDGKIKIGGKEVEKVMVEGDDLFAKGYKMLTKNLDASVINKVEVYNRYSNNRLLKGIEESERVALNLTLKNNVKNKIFGVLKPGYGLASENRYDASANIISFREKNKFYGFTNFNNVGIETTAALSEMTDSGSETNFESMESEQGAISFIKLINYKPDVGDERTNFNNAEMASLNNIYSFSPRLKLKTIGFLDWDENKFFRNSLDTYFLPTGTFTTIEDYDLYGRTFSGFANAELTFDISKDQIFEYSGKFNGSSMETNTSLLFNNDFSKEFLEESPFSTNQTFKYTNRLRPNRALSINGYYIHSKNPQKYKSSRFLFVDLFESNGGNNGVHQLSMHKMNVAGVDASLFNKRKNGDLLQAKVGTNFFNNNYTSNFTIEGLDERPAGFQNSSIFNQFNVYFEPSYKLKLGAFAFTGNINFTQNITTLDSKNVILKKSPFFINPKITLDWELNKKNRITSFFKHENKMPSTESVQDGFVLTQYNTFSKGLQQIDPLDNSTFFVNYMLGTILSTFYANTSFIYIKNDEYLGLKSEFTRDYILNELTRLKDKEFANIQTELNIFIKSLASNAKVKIGYNEQRFENIVNGSLRQVDASTLNYGGELRSAFGSPINFHIGTEWFQSNYKTNITEQENLRNRTFLDIVYEPIKNLNLSLNSSRYFFSGLNIDNDAYYFMDFEGSYPLIKNTVSLAVMGKNLLNTRTLRNLMVDDTGVFQSEYRLLPRFFILKAKVRF